MHPAPTKPLPKHVVRANRAGFSVRMWRIIEQANTENEKIIAKHILMRSNGKPRSSDHSKWEKLKNKLLFFLVFRNCLFVLLTHKNLLREYFIRNVAWVGMCQKLLTFPIT